MNELSGDVSGEAHEEADGAEAWRRREGVSTSSNPLRSALFHANAPERSQRSREPRNLRPTLILQPRVRRGASRIGAAKEEGKKNKKKKAAAAAEVKHRDEITPERCGTTEALILACGHTSWF